jgi:hypothetical protein
MSRASAPSAGHNPTPLPGDAFVTLPFTRLVPLALAIPLFLCSVPTGSLAAGTAPPAGDVVLQPSDATGNPISDPGYFQVTAGSGSSTTLYALVGNAGKQNAVVSIVPVDARSGVYGGISYNLPQQHSKHVGKWIKLSTGRVAVRPGRAAIERVTINVPAGTRPGQYIGGLTAFVPVAGPKSTRGPHQRNNSIVLQLRRVVAVVLTVPGPTVARFKIGHVNPKQRPDAVYLIANVRNTGTTLLKGQGHVWMWKQGTKRPILSTALHIDTTVPGTTVLYPVLWSKHPAPGLYTITATMTWTGGKVTQHGKFTWTAKH